MLHDKAGNVFRDTLELQHVDVFGELGLDRNLILGWDVVDVLKVTCVMCLAGALLLSSPKEV